jgi:hypothetical protein
MFKSAWVTSHRWSDRRRGPPIARLTGTATGLAALPSPRAPADAPRAAAPSVDPMVDALAVSSATAVAVSSADASLSVAVKVSVIGTSVYD